MEVIACGTSEPYTNNIELYAKKLLCTLYVAN